MPLRLLFLSYGLAFRRENVFLLYTKVQDSRVQLNSLHYEGVGSNVYRLLDYLENLMFILITLAINLNFQYRSEYKYIANSYHLTSGQKIGQVFYELLGHRTKFPFESVWVSLTFAQLEDCWYFVEEAIGFRKYIQIWSDFDQQNIIIISLMKPYLYQPSQLQPMQGSYQQHNYTPFQYAKSQQIKPANLPTQNPPTQYLYNPVGYDPTKKISTTIRAVEEKKDSISNAPQKKITKPAFLTANRQTHDSYSGFNTMHDSQNLRREESEPDLRTTCPNVFKKIEQQNNNNNNFGKQPTTLRYTTHGNGLSKLGSVITEARKYEQQQQQKAMKRNAAIVEHHSHKFQSPYKSMTDPKKIFDKSEKIEKVQKSQKASFKSLNQIWSNKERSVQKPKKNAINGFEVFKQLGKGKFGQVYLAIHLETGFVVALKKIVKAKIIQYKMIQQFKRQIRLHSALDHPNIVKFYGFFEDAESIYLILEYITGGTLFDYLAEKDVLSPKEAAEFLKDTIEALCYMHQRSIAHRDIKPENIVLTAEKVAKLCDFGWSALVQSSRTTYCGTFDYAPPQILERKNYDTAVDMWCIGVLAFELLTGRVPFEGQKRKQIMQKIISVDKTKIIYPVEIPDDAKNFIQQLVQKDPTLRPKCKDLLKHPFIVNNTKKVVPNGKQKKF